MPEPPRPPVAERLSLESWIGGRWFAVLGALAVLVAIALFLRLAYVNGYFKLIPDGVRCAIGAAFGMLLLAGGEFARRKINAWASAGLSAAGVAGIYASVLAAYGMYHLLPDSVAFILLAATSGLGIAVSARARIWPVAGISVIGAYLAPFLLEATDPNPLVFPAYLLAILAAGLVLSAWLRAGFRIVGSMVWWGTLILGGVWVVASGGKDTFHSAIAFALLTFAWAMVHAAHIFATRPEPRESTEESAYDERPSRAWETPPIHEVWLIASSFTFSTWAAGLAVLIAREVGTIPDWLPPFALAGVTALLSAVLAGRLRVLTDLPITGRERLGAALMTQSGALIVAGTALLASGNSAVIVWLALGIAAIAAGRWIRSRGLDVYGAVVLSIGTGRWLLYESWASGMMTPWRETLGLVFSQWMLIGLVAAAAWSAAAFGLNLNLPEPSRGKRRPLAVVCAALGLLVLMAASVHPDAQHTSTSIVWIAIGAAAVALGGFGRRVRLDELGTAVLSIAAFKLVGVDSWQGGISAHGAAILGLVASPWMLCCLLSCAVWLMVAIIVPSRIQRDRPDPESAVWALWIGRIAAGLGMFMAVLAALNDQALGTSIALAWMTLGLIAIIFAPSRPSLGLGLMGYTILAMAAVRLLLVDGLTDMPTDGSLWAGLFLSRWMLAMGLAGAAWLFAGVITAIRNQPGPIPQRLPTVASAASVALWMFGVVHPQAHMASVLFVWLGIATLAAACAPFIPRLRMDWWSCCASLVCVAGWFVAHAATTRFDWTGSTAILMMHPGLWSALWCAGLMALLTRRTMGLSEELGAPLRTALWALAIALIWGGTTLEAGRIGASLTGERTVRLAMVSIWWSVFAVGLIIGGFRVRVPLARHAGLGLMALAGLKVVLFDLGGVPDVWRIASFLALGLLMIGVAVGYSKLTGAIATRSEHP